MAPSAQAVLSTAASLAASAVLVRTIANDLIPHPLQDYLFSTFQALADRFSSQITVVIHEFDGFSTNQIYEAAGVYLSGRVSPATSRLEVAKTEEQEKLRVNMVKGDEVIDTFQGVQFRWRMLCREVERTVSFHSRHNGGAILSEIRCYELRFHRKHKGVALDSYLQWVVAEARTMKRDLQAVKLHSAEYSHLYGNLTDVWRAVKLNHPATFETLAMDPEQKEAVMEDLKRFVKRREFYRKLGKAWKRGYLLYGPPGTGKSSLIAAMANYLKFDVYDLELTEVHCNSELKKLLIATANRSILVIEDIDCTIGTVNRENSPLQAPENNNHQNGAPKHVTLSGLLNFVDGLWSSCGDERIIIFTTNHKEKLDPALLRPGRMDVHIHMHFLRASAFEILARNHLGIHHHPLFDDIKRLLEAVEATPAEVAEELMKHDSDPDASFRCLIEFLERKKPEGEETRSEEQA